MCSRSFPFFSALFISLLFFSCNPGKEKSLSESKAIKIPEFNADSAYALVDRQVSFGPRIPNTKAHREAGDFILNKLKSYGAKTTVQEFQAMTFDGNNLSLRNIIGSFNPSIQKRVLLAAHWDTRPFSDKDKENPEKTFDGANDGASGVGVLLEIARHLAGTEAGVDIIFFDGEDWGDSDNVPTWWCLGSQYWAKHKHSPGYQAYYGILLDMVGGANARFFQEGSSVSYAPRIVEKVWKRAGLMGYGSVFVQQKEDPIIDDHVFVNEIADIPMIDITPFEPGVGYFGSFHHTQKDNMDLINKETLGIVGRVLMQVIYLEE